MGEVLGIGCTHAPHLQFTDEDMANVLKRTLRSERTPAEMREPRNWPPGMVTEWGEDEGLSAAKDHRQQLADSFRAARRALDEFNPDFLLIWGDDQYENFKVDLLTPFCVFAAAEFTTEPFKPSDGLRASSNVWNEPTDTVMKVPGHPEAASRLVEGLISTGFDVSCSYRLHHAHSLSHAFTRTLLYLDYDRAGLNYPVIPFHVNCYGSNLRVPLDDLSNGPAGQMSPPPAPPPWRCYDLGKQVASILRDSPWRAALIGSSSWSHGTLTAKHHFLYPDVETDRRRWRDLQSGDLRGWRDLDLPTLVDAGQHETLNWICLAGAMEGSKVQKAAYIETYLFNSDKAMAVWEPR
jgi:hypothetical protein